MMIYHLDLKINNERIVRVNECKHLGVIIDETLSWSQHIDHIKKKVAPGLFYLRKAKQLIPSNMQCLLYNSIISPHFDYCNVVWGNCNQSQHDKLQVLQNRAAKIICGVNKYGSSSQALKDLKWDNIKERLYKNEAVTMYKAVNNLAPEYICNRFCIKESKYNMRASNTLVIAKPNTEFKKRCFTYRGAKLWNELDNDARNASTLANFKSQII